MKLPRISTKPNISNFLSVSYSNCISFISLVFFFFFFMFVDYMIIVSSVVRVVVLVNS